MLQPVNADGTSVFKQGSTVVVKFRDYDANGASVGTPGVITKFRLVGTQTGTVENAVDEAVNSNTPDTEFRWDPTGQVWIFNLSTKTLAKNTTYFYRITLADASVIEFHFGLK